jgi:hypothetical protein
MRIEEIANRRLVVIDQFLDPDEIQSLWGFLDKQAYRQSEYDGKETAHIKQWALNLPPDAMSGLGFIQRVEGAVREHFAVKDAMTPSRFYCNALTYGDMTFPHRDCAPGGGLITALLYANHVWKPQWGGETLFYDDAEDPLYSIMPKPGRLALFNGDVIHKAGTPSRECYDRRLTFAMKFQPAESRV